MECDGRVTAFVNIGLQRLRLCFDSVASRRLLAECERTAQSSLTRQPNHSQTCPTQVDGRRQVCSVVTLQSFTQRHVKSHFHCHRRSDH